MDFDFWCFRQKIAEHNNGKHSYTLAMNHLGDLTEGEYRNLMLGTKYRTGMNTSRSTFLPASNVQLPAKVDWREKGYVTEVKDQGRNNQVFARLRVLSI